MGAYRHPPFLGRFFFELATFQAALQFRSQPLDVLSLDIDLAPVVCKVYSDRITMYRELRTSGRRTLPPDVPTDFAPKALESLIRRDGAIDRRRWESALFLKVRDEIRVGNLAIDGAKNFARFESFFLPAPQWQQTGEAFWARTGFAAESNSAAKQLKARLSAAFERFLEDVPRNRQVSFDDDGWRLKTDRAEQLEPEQSALLVELRPEPVMSDEDRVRLARFAPAGRSAEGVLGMALFGRVGLFSAHVPARA